MRKRWILYGVCLLAALLPALRLTAGEDTVALARVLYAHCAQQPDDTMYAFGATVLNRVGREEFGLTLRAVLSQYGAYETGARYDARTLAAAEQLISGLSGRELPPEDVVYAVGMESDQTAYGEKRFWRVSGAYVFYCAET